MLRILHTGDIHLDSPFSGLDERRAEVRKTELRGTFSSLMTYVRTNPVDLLLIAGDFFDRGFVTRETLGIIMREFSRVPETRIVISPGNHDPYTKDSVYARVKFPPNVYIFKDNVTTRFEFPEINCDVYGYAFTSESQTVCPALSTDDNGRVRVLCAHADLNAAASSYSPVTIEKLASAGFDYAALGHIHNAPEPSARGGCVAAYCGCLEGRGFDETGVKGALLVQFGDDGKLMLRRLPFSHRRYETADVSVTGASSIYEIRERVSELIHERKYADDTVLRVTLKGEVTPQLVVSTELVANGINEVYALEVRDETTPALDLEYLDSDPTVKGAFYRELKPKLEDDDPDVRRRAIRALRYGLAAMSGENITD